MHSLFVSCVLMLYRERYWLVFLQTNLISAGMTDQHSHLDLANGLELNTLRIYIQLRIIYIHMMYYIYISYTHTLL